MSLTSAVCGKPRKNRSNLTPFQKFRNYKPLKQSLPVRWQFSQSEFDRWLFLAFWPMISMFCHKVRPTRDEDAFPPADQSNRSPKMINTEFVGEFQIAWGNRLSPSEMSIHIWLYNEWAVVSSCRRMSMKLSIEHTLTSPVIMIWFSHLFQSSSHYANIHDNREIGRKSIFSKKNSSKLTKKQCRSCGNVKLTQNSIRVDGIHIRNYVSLNALTFSGNASYKLFASQITWNSIFSRNSWDNLF